MRWPTRTKTWFVELFTPVSSVPAVLPVPPPLGEVLLTQVIVAHILGPKAPLVDKVAFVVSPHIVRAAARQGASNGARLRDARLSNAIDVDGWLQ